MALSDLLSGIRATAQSVESQWREKRRAREQLRRDRDALRARPATKADIKAMMLASIEAKRGEYAQHFATSLSPFIRQPERITDMRDRRPSLAAAAAPEAEFLSPADVDRLLCVLFPDQVAAAVTKLVDEMADFPADGLSLAERTKQTARLNDRIQKMDDELDAVVAAAREAGLVLNLHHLEDL